MSAYRACTVHKLIFILSLCFYCLYSIAAKASEPGPVNELQHLLHKSKLDTGRISVLLEIGMWYVYKPGADPKDIDSAISFTDQAMALSRSLKEPRWEAKVLMQYSFICREQNKTDRGKEYIDTAITAITKYGTKADLAYAYYELANYYSPYIDTIQFGKRIWCIEQSAHYFDIGNEKGKYAEVLYTLCDLYMMERAYATALDTLQKMLVIYREINNPRVQYIYDLMGSIYGSLGNYTMQIRYCQLAIQAVEVTKDTSMSTCTVNNRMAIAYDNIKQWSHAIPFYKKALSIAMKYNDKISIYVIMPNLMNSYRVSGLQAKGVAELEFVERKYKPENIDDRIRFIGVASISYLELKKFTLARKYHQEVLAANNSYTEFDPMHIYLYGYLIEYSLISKDYKEADKYCQRSERFCKRYGYVRSSSKNYKQWSKADSALGHYDAALSHYQMYVTINDSLFNEAKTKEIAQLQIQYETEKKEQDIQLLTRQTLLQDTQLIQTKLTKNLLLGSAGMLALLLWVGFNRYRLKQRSNKELEERQEEINKKNESLDRLVKEKEWLVKEMHHRVKNNLQVVMSLLNTQSMYLDNAAAQAAIQESQHRMHTISLIHQKLYQSDNSAMVSMRAYVCELIDYLRDSLDAGTNIIFEQNIENVQLDVAQAMPVGLILNEAVTNAIKYAFPGDGKGVIRVSMLRNNAQRVSLVIADDGIGLPDYSNIHKSGSLGMSLMEGLAIQLGGELILVNDNGLRIEIEFSEAKEMIVNKE